MAPTFEDFKGKIRHNLIDILSDESESSIDTFLNKKSISKNNPDFFYDMVGKDVRFKLKTGEELEARITGWEGYNDDGNNYVECVEYTDKETGLLCGIMDYEVESAEILNQN